MPRAERPWTVTPHSEIQKLSHHLWVVESQVPNVPMGRRMAIVKRSDGRLDFFHAIPLDDKALAEVMAWGKPAHLVIGHNQHGVDANAFREKLGVKLFGPKENLEALRARWGEVGALEDVPKDPVVEFFSAAGTKRGDAIGLVRSGNTASLLFSDAFMNVSGGHWTMRVAGFSGGPKVPPVFKLLFTKDKAALKAQLQQLADTAGLTHLVPCHGDIVSSDAAAVLRKAAAAA
jgi:hypothetical protein